MRIMARNVGNGESERRLGNPSRLITDGYQAISLKVIDAMQGIGTGQILPRLLSMTDPVNNMAPGCKNSASSQQPGFQRTSLRTKGVS